MHIVLAEQEHDHKGIMCVERDAQSCIILKGNFEEITRLAAMAQALGAPRVLLVTTDRELAGVLGDHGWKLTQRIVLEKDLKNGT